MGSKEKEFRVAEIPLSILITIGRIIKLLESRSFEGIDADHIKTALADLPRDLADDALRIAVCEDGKSARKAFTIYYRRPRKQPSTRFIFLQSASNSTMNRSGNWLTTRLKIKGQKWKSYEH